MGAVIKFGKYRGYALARLADDPDYVSWLKAQDWLEERHPEVFAYINGMEIPSLKYCAALTREGNPCMFWAVPQFGDKCRRHFNRDTSDDFMAWAGEMVSA